MPAGRKPAYFFAFLLCSYLFTVLLRCEVVAITDPLLLVVVAQKHRAGCKRDRRQP